MKVFYWILEDFGAHDNYFGIHDKCEICVLKMMVWWKSALIEPMGSAVRAKNDVENSPV